MELSGKTILITGAAGFIGWNLAERLLHSYPDITIVGLDNLNDYYDVKLKEARLERLTKYPNLIFEKGDLSDKKAYRAALREASFRCCCQSRRASRRPLFNYKPRCLRKFKSNWFL